MRSRTLAAFVAALAPHTIGCQSCPCFNSQKQDAPPPAATRTSSQPGTAAPTAQNVSAPLQRTTTATPAGNPYPTGQVGAYGGSSGSGGN